MMNQEKFGDEIENCGCGACPLAEECKAKLTEEEEVGESVKYTKAQKRGLLNRIEKIKKEILSTEDKEIIQERGKELEKLQKDLEDFPKFVGDIE